MILELLGAAGCGLVVYCTQRVLERLDAILAVHRETFELQRERNRRLRAVGTGEGRELLRRRLEERASKLGD